MEKLVIIDGNSLINRAYYALPRLSNFEGVVSNGVFGFVNILIKIINEIKPKYIAVAFDVARQTFRNEIYKDYKGTRKETPEELKLQFPILKQVLSAMNVKIIEQQNIEADDIIGSLTKKFNVENIIVSGDKDVFQLINKNTSVLFTKKGISETENCSESSLCNYYGVNANQVVDLKALMGDSSDNIPGVKGVGEKTAANLIATYGSLDAIYKNVESLKGKLKEMLEKNKELAYISKQLATIKCDVPLNITLSDLTYDFPFNAEVLKLFKKYQFNSLIKKPELFETDLKEISNDFININPVSVKNVDEIKGIIEKINKTKKIYLVIESGISLTVDETEYKFMFTYDLFNSGLDISNVINMLKPVFENENISKVVFDYKTILHKLKEYGCKLTGKVFDVLIARYLINSNVKQPSSFKELVIENNLNEKLSSGNLHVVESEYQQKLQSLGLIKLYDEIEMPLVDVLFHMETAGFKLDINELNKLDSKYNDELKQLTIDIYDMVGQEFNINSPKQLSEILFDKLNINTANNKKKSTGVDVLNEIAYKHPIVPLILRYRKISKLHTTYVKSYIEIVNAKTNKIYTVFNQTLTSTGRLSSTEPNLQNIPIRTDEGKALRKIFIPTEKDGFIVSADYSQIELRLLADFSGDEKLITAFNNGIDIHTLTASEVFNVEVKYVTPEMRRDAKAINFGIVYGISDYGLSQNIGSSRKSAKEYIEKYFERYPKIKSYMDANVAFCKNNGYVKTLFGRIRNIPEIKSSNFNVRSFGERAAMNMPLQGSASDIIKLAMIKVFNEFKKHNLKSKLILQVHDELVVDCVKDELETVKIILKNVMEKVVALKIKLDVNIEYGANWYEAK